MKTRKKSYLPRFKALLKNILIPSMVVLGFFVYLFLIIEFLFNYLLSVFGVFVFFIILFLIFLYFGIILLIGDYLEFKSTNK